MKFAIVKQDGTIEIREQSTWPPVGAYLLDVNMEQKISALGMSGTSQNIMTIISTAPRVA